MTKRKTTVLLETVHSQTLRVDRAAGVIRGVKIIGRQSKNGREYSDAALAEAARLYEGTGVNIDHPSRDDPDQERRIADAFGHLRNVAQRADGVYGDLAYLRSHALAEQVCEAAERMPLQLGLSHNAEGYVVHRDGRWIVEGIARVRSVDLVRNPATNRGLFESAPPADRDAEAAAFPALVRAVLEDASLTEAAMRQRIRALAAAPEQRVAKGAEGTQAGTALDELARAVGRLERRERARALLERAGLEADGARVAALAELQTEAEMQALVESWPSGLTRSAWQQPRSQPPAALPRLAVDLENPREVAEFLRG